MARKPKKLSPNSIAVNRKARFDYFIEETIEAGVVLEGWEVKSLREGKGQITETYVLVRNGEAWLLGAHITPLNTVSTHITPEPTRSRKLLLNRKELDRLQGLVDRQGYTLVALELYWKKGRVKAAIGLAKGKKQQDKRATIRERDWQRDRERLMKVRISR